MRIRHRKERAEMPDVSKYPSPTRSCIHHSFALQMALRDPSLPFDDNVISIIVRYFYPRVSPRDLAHLGGPHTVIEERAIPLVRSPTELSIRHENYATFARFLDLGVFGNPYAPQLRIEEEIKGQQTAILIETQQLRRERSVALRAIEKKEASKKHRDKVRRKRKW
jgi:hypothetical protein